MKNIFKIALLFLFIGIFASACKDIQKIHPATIAEEGYYIVGSSIKTDSLGLSAVMDKGVVEDANGTQYSRDSLFTKFFFATAAGDGFAVKQQHGDTTTTWGINGDWTNPHTGVYVADVQEEGNNFTVPDDGTYFFAIDLSNLKAYLFSITEWTLEGDAITSGNTLTVISEDKDSSIWGTSDVGIQSGKFKYKFYSNDVYYFEGDTVGLPMYLGSALTAPEYAGDEIEILADPGTFYINLKYDFNNGFCVSTDIPMYDPRTHTWSLIGDAFYQENDPNNAATAWDKDFDLTFDATVSDTLNGIYKFVKDGMYFIGGKEFKIRQDNAWDICFGYNDVDGITGDINNIINAGGQYGNFKVVNDAKYDVTFTYDVIKNKIYIDFTASQN